MISFDKYYPVVFPSIWPTSSDLFAKRVERLDAERALNVQIKKQVEKFHQYEYEIYQYRMRQVTLNISVENERRQIDQLV